MEEKNLYFYKPTISVGEIRDICLDIKDKSEKNKLVLIPIDCIQLIEFDPYAKDISRDNELTKIIIKLKKLAIELDFPLMST